MLYENKSISQAAEHGDFTGSLTVPPRTWVPAACIRGGLASRQRGSLRETTQPPDTWLPSIRTERNLYSHTPDLCPKRQETQEWAKAQR